MKLSRLLENIEVAECRGNMDRDISLLACDSRKVKTGALFCALPGAQVDGSVFIPQAIANGASVILAEQLPTELDSTVCYLRVVNARYALAKIAAEFFGQPTRNLPVIGVTGTNGKTTITYLLEAVMKQAGFAPAVFGTVEYRFAEERLESSHTTPESLDLLRMMADFRSKGADAFILEVSSHALEQHRVDGIEFDVAIFTNLTPEHLDYHENLANYFASKRRLFSELLKEGRAAINCDDSFGRQLLAENPDWTSFGAQHAAQVKPLDLTVGREGIKGRFSTPGGPVQIDSALIGDFNISNLLATVTATQLLGIQTGAIEAGLAKAAQVPGRLQRIENDRDVLALVDYAHTGDALEQVLQTLARLDYRRLLTVVGCGGDRDPRKRPVMAAAAVNYADLAIFTSDNPRTEDPLRILAAVRAGAIEVGAVELDRERAKAGERGFVVIPDRREAINFAASLAGAGDQLLLAGKGHEDYQILGTTKVHFDDREELHRALVESITLSAGDADV